MPRLDLAHRPNFFGHPVSEPYGPVKHLRGDVVIDAETPLHEQLGPDEPEHDSLRDWFIERTQVPLDEGNGTPLVGLLNAYVYRYIHPEITSYHKLSFRARGDVELCARFGFDPSDPLDHSTLSRAYWERLGPENRSHLQLRAAQAAVDAAKAGFEVNDEASLLAVHHLPEAMCHYPEVDPVVDEDDTVEVTDAQKQEAGERVERFLHGIDLHRPDKGTEFDDMEIVEPWKRASIEGRFAEGTSETYDDHDTGSDYDAPCGETLRKPIRDLEIEDEEIVESDLDETVVDYEAARDRVRAEKWGEQLDALNVELLEEAQSYGMFDREVTICVDGTSIEHRPQMSDSAPNSCVKNRGDESSVWCYKQITISAVDCRRSLKLGSVLMRRWNHQSNAVMELLKEAMKHVNIGWVIWDGGFDTGALISFCNHHDLRFVGRKKNQGDVVDSITEETANEEGTTAWEENYQYTSGAKCHVFAIQRGEINLANVSSDGSQTAIGDFLPDGNPGEKWILWTTNSDSLDDHNIIAHGMLYRVRWSIETSYRVIKEHFKASTTSIRDALRIWIWKLAMVLYNAWVLLRILVRDKGVSVAPGEAPVKTHSFQRILQVDYG